MTDFSFDSIKDAFGKGLENVTKAYGVETDPQLRNYNSLQQDDFQAIAKRFGMEETAQYIEEMERRRLKRS